MKKTILSTLLVTFMVHAKTMDAYDKCIERFSSYFHERDSSKLNALCISYAHQKEAKQ